MSGLRTVRSNATGARKSVRAEKDGGLVRAVFLRAWEPRHQGRSSRAAQRGQGEPRTLHSPSAPVVGRRIIPVQETR